MSSADEAAKKIEANVMGLGNKQSALLARIKAAQQKTRPPEPEAPVPKKNVDTSMYDPYNQKAAPTTSAAVPTEIPDIPPVEAPPAPAPSAADALDDLFGFGLSINNNNDQETTQAAPTQEHVEETFEEILGLEGLTEEDRNALLEEQQRILAAIEAENKGKSAQDRKADAFESRSLSRAVQPTVGVAIHDDLEAAQLAADEELARELQREEYKRAERRGNSQTNAPAPAPAADTGSSWMEWLGFGPAPGSGPSGPPPSFAQRPLERGEIGVSLPAGSRRVETETVTFSGGPSSGSFDSRGSPSRERDRLMSGGGSPQRAVVAEQKPIFSCIADSVNQATQMASEYATQAMYGDMGVDHSSLLNQQQDDDAPGYSQMPGNNN